MTPVNCIIVDDEPIARRGMRRLVEMREELSTIGSAANVKEAERLLNSEDAAVDLIFLDIDMEGENGLEFARRLGKKVKVIFTTAYAGYALESYEVEAVDYLLKPIRKERFNRAVDRILGVLERESRQYESLQPPTRCITVKADRKFIRINIDDILFIEGLGDYIVFHLPDRRLTSRMTFKALEEELADTHIIRINKSYMVNRNKVESFDTNQIVIGEKIIPVGATYKEIIKSMATGL